MRTAAATRIRKPNLVMLCAQAFSNISGYVPGSDVTEHNKIDLDQSAMEAALADTNWPVATKWYTEGGSSAGSKGSFRSPACGEGATLALRHALCGADRLGCVA